MRLTDIQRAVIREEVQRHFGENVRPLLFGSRVRDDARGGDIDLYIEAEGSPQETLARELKLYAVLQRRLGEQRIDLVVHRVGSPLRPIDREARDTGVAL
ncbi:MAG: nucleotidyltransferase domain-containing protein [Gallionellaceae bacterium]